MVLQGKNLVNKANQIRSEVIKVAVKNKAGHIAPSLSSVDLLVVLYYNILSYDEKDPLWVDRDRLIFSKGHGCYAIYAILADKGVLSRKEWEHFYTGESSLAGCIERNLACGFEASCGSLGHGLPIAVGMAFAASLKHRKYRIYCIIGDGEMQEGTTWEAIQFAVKYGLNNLTIIVDDNRLQAMDFITNILDKDTKDKVKRLEGFGLRPVVCPGHNIQELVRCLNKSKSSLAKFPKVIIAETVKGFGLKCMENVPKFHFRIPTEEELAMGGSND